MGVFAYNYPQIAASPDCLWVLFWSKVVPDFQKALKYLEYVPETGDFLWKVDRGRVKSGTKAGSVSVSRSGKRYIHIHVQGTYYVAHTLAFVVMVGEKPKYQVDHLNGDGCDNRWCNLRDVSQADNCKNRRRPRNNRSGSLGVRFNTGHRRWQAYINVNRKRVHLGFFLNKEDAVSRRKAAELEYGFHPNHGQDRPL